MYGVYIRFWPTLHIPERGIKTPAPIIVGVAPQGPNQRKQELAGDPVQLLLLSEVTAAHGAHPKTQVSTCMQLDACAAKSSAAAPQ